MAEVEEIDSVKGVSGTSRSVESFQRILERHTPNREHFEALMQQTQTVKTEVPAQDPQQNATDKAPSLMDEVARLNTKVHGLNEQSYDQLIAQAREANQQIGQIQNQLNQPNLELRNSVQNLLRNKLTDIQDNLQVALNKAGVDFIPPEPVAAGPGGNPVTKFLDLLANGQHNLERLSGGIELMAENGREVSPASLLSIQLKVHKVQQQLEFFTSLLNKALESTKTLMNVQV